MLYSFEKKTLDKSTVKIIVGIDEDDSDSIEYAGQYKGPNVKFDIKTRTRALNNRLNQMVDENPADFYWGLNDDVEIRTEGWEKLLTDKSPLYIKNTNDGEGPSCFPIMSHSLKSILGFFLPPHIDNLAADDVLFDIISANPSLISYAPIDLWHYKYGSREVGWFRRTLDRTNYSQKMDLTSEQINRYKGIVQKILPHHQK